MSASALRASIVVVVVTLGCAEPPPNRWIEPMTGMEFVRVPAGEFRMGSPASESGHQDNETLHRVRLTKPFYLTITEVTGRQWDEVMPSSSVRSDPDLPVVNVTWYEVTAFLEKLSAFRRGRYRLPTEAEWEYACRAGTTTAYSTGDALTTDQANYNGEFPLPGQTRGLNRGALSKPRSFPPNPWGLFDEHGNAWEWTADPLCPYDTGTSVDPSAACEASVKVIRGGSWRFNADSARCALRYTHRPQDRGDSLGFRVVRETP